MSYLLEKVVRFIQKTKDHCIVLDQKGSIAYVIMPFEEYENFIEGGAGIKNLTEDELLEKINRDIALWRSAQDVEHRPEWDSLAELSEAEELKRSSNKDTSKETVDNSEKVDQIKEGVKDRYYFEPIE